MSNGENRSRCGLLSGLVLATTVAFLVASGAAVFAGTDVKINQDVGIDLQNEISLALDTTSSSRIVAAYNDDADNSGGWSTGPGIGVSYSSNSGSTWNTTHTPTVWGHDFDPSATADRLGNFFVGSIASTTTWFYPQATTAVVVHRSTDGGASWSQPTTVEAFYGNGVATVPFVDKSYVAVDTSASSSYADRLYIVWQRDATDYIHSEIYSAYSTSQAATFTVPVKVNDQSIGTSLGNAAVPAVSPDGTLCVAWIDTMQTQSSQTTGTIFFDKSTDGGATFGQDTTAATLTKVAKNPNPPPFSSFRANSFPSIAVDPSNAANIYIVYTGDPDGAPGPDAGDIFFVRSTNGGQTWSAPTVVNDDGGTKGQFSPWIDVAPSGAVYVAWYDRRNDPLDKDLDIYYAVSNNGGTSFSANQTVNDQQIRLSPDATVSTSWLGEYLGLAVDGSNAHFAWTDTRAGEKDIFFDKLSTGAGGDTTPPITTISTSPAGPDGQNGWYRTTPIITLSVNETATTYNQWDSTAPAGYQPYLAAFSPLEGQHTLYYFSVDSSNNTETVSSAQFKVDTQPPSGVMAIDNGASIATTVTISADSTVTGASLMRFRQGSAFTIGGWSQWETYAATKALTLPAGDGAKTVIGQYKDDAGNMLTLSDSIVLETGAPGAPSSLTAGAEESRVALSWTNPTDGDFDVTRVLRSSSGFAASASDATGQAQVYEDTGTAHVDTGLTNGVLYYYTAFARDFAGNWSAAATATARPRMLTSLTLWSPRTLVANLGAVQLIGSLVTSAGPIANATVTVWGRPSTGFTWTQEATATYEPTSTTYRANRWLAVNTVYQMRFSGDTTCAPANSNELTVSVRAYLSGPWLIPSSFWRGRWFSVYGYLRPRHGGTTRLDFYRRVGGVWRFYTRGYARNYNYSTYTRYRYTSRLLRSGRYYVQAYHSDADHAPSASPTRVFTVY